MPQTQIINWYQCQTFTDEQMELFLDLLDMYIDHLAMTQNITQD